MLDIAFQPAIFRLLHYRFINEILHFLSGFLGCFFGCWAYVAWSGWRQRRKAK